MATPTYDERLAAYKARAAAGIPCPHARDEHTGFGCWQRGWRWVCGIREICPCPIGQELTEDCGTTNPDRCAKRAPVRYCEMNEGCRGAGWQWYNGSQVACSCHYATKEATQSLYKAPPAAPSYPWDATDTARMIRYLIRTSPS